LTLNTEGAYRDETDATPPQRGSEGISIVHTLLDLLDQLLTLVLQKLVSTAERGLWLLRYRIINSNRGWILYQQLV
jgi:hypothetical protein